MTYTVYLYNFGYSLEGSHATITAALERAKAAGFDANIVDSEGSVVASWSTIGGSRWFLLRGFVFTEIDSSAKAQAREIAAMRAQR